MIWLLSVFHFIRTFRICETREKWQEVVKGLCICIAVEASWGKFVNEAMTTTNKCRMRATLGFTGIFELVTVHHSMALRILRRLCVRQDV